MLGPPAKGVAVLGAGFRAGQQVSVTVTDPNGVVYDLQDELVAEDGSVGFGVPLLREIAVVLPSSLRASIIGV